MKLMTEELKKQIPELYSQDGKGMDAVVYVRYFCVFNSWTWYVTEFDGEDTFFGYVCGFEDEFGYFTLAELNSTGKIERDLYFTPDTLKNCLKRDGRA